MLPPDNFPPEACRRVFPSVRFSFTAQEIPIEKTKNEPPERFVFRVFILGGRKRIGLGVPFA
jgi:hypothetical protein